MKLALVVLIFHITSVFCLSLRKLVVKSRSAHQIESTTGVKLNLPVPKPHEKEESTNAGYKQPSPVLANLVQHDNRDYDEVYWYNPQIHSLGNVGILGALHAALGALSSHVIDNVAYDGIDMRFEVAKELQERVGKREKQVRVLDMCCGVGMSTRALRKAFPEAQEVMGLDTSPQMVAMANFLTNHLAFVGPLLEQIKRRFKITGRLLDEQRGKLNSFTRYYFRGLHFKKANAQDTQLPDESFDLITIMYAFHEVPKKGREQIIKEARRLLAPGGLLAVVDISSDYHPSPHMLAGEPYVIEYQQNFSTQLRHMKGFLHPHYKTLVPGHLGMWTLRRSLNAV